MRSLGLQMLAEVGVFMLAMLLVGQFRSPSASRFGYIERPPIKTISDESTFSAVFGCPETASSGIDFSRDRLQVTIARSGMFGSGPISLATVYHVLRGHGLRRGTTASLVDPIDRASAMPS